MQGKVYVLQSGNSHYYKIGLTKDSIKKRIAQLQTGNPYRITARLVQTVHSMQVAEDILHRRYYQQRGIGEWFYFGPGANLISHIEITEVLQYIKTELNAEVAHRLELKDVGV